MAKIVVNKKNFQFDKFTKTILDFHATFAPPEFHPSAYLFAVDSTNNAERGPEGGWNNFLELLSQGQRLYFPFSMTNCGEPISCADGQEYEIDEDSEFNMGETDTVGFLIKLDHEIFTIQSAMQSGSDHPSGIWVSVDDCDAFGKPMKRFINSFIT